MSMVIIKHGHSRYNGKCMKAVKLASGKYRARYVDHYERDANGKRKVITGSVIADTEAEAVRLAKSMQGANKADGKTTVALAIDSYIKLKSNVISPATLRAYKSLQKNAYNEISAIRLSELTTAILQRWVSNYAAGHKPKSVANAYGLLTASVAMYLPDVSFHVTLPQRNPAQLYTPTEKEIKLLLKEAKDKPKLYKALILATYGLRRGEICALAVSDIDQKTNTIKVCKNMVRAGKHDWQIKEPKTPQSIRYVSIAPNAVRTLLSDCNESNAQLVGLKPDALTNAFTRLLEDTGLPKFRLHDIRAFSASLQHAIGVPDQYIMKAHGWKTDTVLKQVYRRTMADKEQEYNKLVSDKMKTMIK